MNSNQDTLKTSLIIEQDSSIGIKLESNGNIFTHKFDSLVSKKFALKSIQCKHVIGIPIEDLKMTATTYGLNS